ncbi:hypothetical protein V8C86DRAFT_2525286 [Haematococcus lacustris]
MPAPAPPPHPPLAGPGSPLGVAHPTYDITTPENSTLTAGEAGHLAGAPSTSHFSSLTSPGSQALRPVVPNTTPTGHPEQLQPARESLATFPPNSSRHVRPDEAQQHVDQAVGPDQGQQGDRGREQRRAGAGQAEGLQGSMAQPSPTHPTTLRPAPWVDLADLPVAQHPAMLSGMPVAAHAAMEPSGGEGEVEEQAGVVLGSSHELEVHDMGGWKVLVGGDGEEFTLIRPVGKVYKVQPSGCR